VPPGIAVGKPVSTGSQYQKKVQQQRMMIQTFQKAIGYEAMFDIGKA